MGLACAAGGPCGLWMTTKQRVSGMGYSPAPIGDGARERHTRSSSCEGPSPVEAHPVRPAGEPDSRARGRIEAEGWIERRIKEQDWRRARPSRHAPAPGVVDQIMAVSSEHEQELTRDLEPSHREALIRLLHQVCHHPRAHRRGPSGFADPNAYQIREEPE